MNIAARVLLIVAAMLQGCHTAHDVAVGSYRVVTTPINLVRHRTVDSPSTTTVTTTTSSDVGNPGVAVSSAPLNTPTPPTNSTGTAHAATKKTAEAKPRPSASPRAATNQIEFPTAKPVEGKPGYVYSPSDPTKYVDISGYAPGSKVKDPYSGKIFLVP
ncbi:MAG: hypothetical protein JWO45_154 [Spartobacteria bacterium]|nr:hypothetical protein [Spartobacteria bacterium]